MLQLVTGAELMRRIRRLEKAHGIPVRFEARPGKGSHGQLCFGERFTTMKDRRKEMGAHLLATMLDQPGISKEDL